MSTAATSAGTRASNANQPVKFLGNTNVKSDAAPWSQNSDNSGNTTHCPTASSPNSQLLHDNVYNLWIMEKRITAPSNGHNYMCVAISNVEDIASTSPAFAWFAFEYDLDTVIPDNSHGNFYYPDYPQTGLWQTSTTTTPPYTAAPTRHSGSPTTCRMSTIRTYHGVRWFARSIWPVSAPALRVRG